MKARASIDAISGLMFAGFGLLGIGLSLKEKIGDAARMGPGYLPLVLSGALALLGLSVLLRGLRSSAAPDWSSALRPLAMVLLSVAAFAACIRSLGFTPAVFAAVTIASYAQSGRKLTNVLLLALVITAFCTLVFVWGLGLSIPAFALPWTS